MKGLLIDENLPKGLAIPTHLNVVHATDFGANPSDGELWNHAALGDWVIVTKDSDFSHRILQSEPPSWVVHVRLGNLRLQDFRARLSTLWPQVEELLPQHKLITILTDRIEAVA